MTGQIYLDHNASTPIDTLVIERMAEAMRTHIANPSSVDHAWGHAAHQAVETARAEIAAQLGARPTDLVFTSGATEANNVAIRGAFKAQRQYDKSRIVTAATEHPSVLQTVKALAEEGADVVTLPVDKSGLIKLDDLKHSLTQNCALVSIMGANNETGVLQPVAEIAATCAEGGVPLHCDLTQVAAHMPIDLAALGVTMASFSGHKIYGPKGIGILFARSRRPRARIVPPSTGGGQERGLRPGTLSTEAILGLAAAFERRVAWQSFAPELEKMRDALQRKLLAIDGLQVNGGDASRLPNTLNVSIEGVDPHALQHRLRDQLIFSTGSACSTDKVHTSPVLSAMFGDGPRARNGFRLGLGRSTTFDEIDRAASLISQVVTMLRSGNIGSVGVAAASV